MAPIAFIVLDVFGYGKYHAKPDGNELEKPTQTYAQKDAELFGELAEKPKTGNYSCSHNGGKDGMDDYKDDGNAERKGDCKKDQQVDKMKDARKNSKKNGKRFKAGQMTGMFKTIATLILLLTFY